jgi:hypothetical protein
LPVGASLPVLCVRASRPGFQGVACLRAAAPKTSKKNFRQIFFKKKCIFFQESACFVFCGDVICAIMTTKSVSVGEFVGVNCPWVLRLPSEGGETAFYLVKDH